jgi:pyruvate dehydrogenase E2 component (dihydrolipoamide acetyltransferase)
MPEVPLIMPKMSMTMSEGEVIGWRKRAGDPVAAGEVVCEVLTDKVDMEVEAPVDGILDRIVATASTTVPVGEPIAFIRTESDDLLGDLFAPPPPAAPVGSGGPAETVPVRRGPSGTTAGAGRTGATGQGAAPDAVDAGAAAGDAGAAPGDARATAAATAGEAGEAGAAPGEAGAGPAAGDRPGSAARATPPSRRGPIPALPGARRRAGELGVRLDGLTGTGPSGSISLADVERAAQQAPADAAAAVTTAPVASASPEPAAGGGVDPGFADALAGRRRSVRAAVARAMAASATVPQFTVFRTLDLGALEQARAGVRVGWTALLVRAFAAALRQHPELNATWTADGPRHNDGIGVALAVDTPVGLLAPVLADPDRVSVEDLDSRIRRAAERARAGQLRLSDLDGATTTVSNLGGFGVESFQALLTPPQATILSLGRIGPQPRVLPGGGIAARVCCTVGLTVDHRTADGADAARLLADLADLTATADKLLTAG